jgi:hypothetical protein
MGAAIVDGHDLDVQVIPAAVGILVVDAGIREVHLLVEVRQVVLTSPFLDFVLVTVEVAVVVGAVAIALVQPFLVLTLELVVENDAINPRAPLFQVCRFAFERAIDLESRSSSRSRVSPRRTSAAPPACGRGDARAGCGPPSSGIPRSHVNQGCA